MTVAFFFLGSEYLLFQRSVEAFSRYFRQHRENAPLILWRFRLQRGPSLRLG